MLIADRAILSVGKGEELLLLAEAVQAVAEKISPQRFEPPRGRQLTASQAAKRLGVHSTAVITWAREGRIGLLGQREGAHHELLVDEADVERARVLLELSGKRQGRSVFPGGGRYGGPLLERLRKAAQER